MIEKEREREREKGGKDEKGNENGGVGGRRFMKRMKGDGVRVSQKSGFSKNVSK